MAPFKGEYSYELNSEDKFETDAVLTRNHAKGGTMILWRKSLDRHISIHQVSTTSFLPVIFTPPGCPTSVHIALYLPTAGKEGDFLEQIAHLSSFISDISEKYKDCLIYIRGDGNVNCNNSGRLKLLNSFLSAHELVKRPINHKTYHHFLGEGLFDSEIDLIIQPRHSLYPELITAVHCRNEDPTLDSHHDAISSTFSLPYADAEASEEDLVEAPRINQTRHKILWSETGAQNYQQSVSASLARLRLRWSDPSSRTSLSILHASTNNILRNAAIACNKSINLNEKKESKSKKTPKEIKVSEAVVKRMSEAVKIAEMQGDLTSKNDATNKLSAKKSEHRKLIRKTKSKYDMIKNEKLFLLLSRNPSTAFRAIKSAKTTSTRQVPYISVGDRQYCGNRVIDGLYESILKLKTLDQTQLKASVHYSQLQEDYVHIKALCENKSDLPQISLKASTDILHGMKPSVSDLSGITPLHYINAGVAGSVHFNLLLNIFILEVNNFSIQELNSVYALLLYKGHNKDRTLDSSYRTISTCPILAKGLDMYVRKLSITKWNSVQADTQCQGEESSHELASLYITEAVQFSKYSSKQPAFLLFLDAQSAFDNVITPFLVRQLYMAGMVGTSLLYIDKRLSSRTTYLEYDKSIVGPIYDDCGLEQGGVSSSDLYKLYNNEQLYTAQESRLGISLGGQHILSAVGQADDVALLSNDLYKLQHILNIVLQYCNKYNVKLSSTKTRLLAIFPPRQKPFIPYNPIKIGNNTIEFSEEAEHVGVVRSSQGNMPHILARIAATKKALGALVSCGLAQASRSNPITSLRILTIYGTPVLMSGLSSLVLSPTEVATVDQQLKRLLQKLMKISVSSPPALVYFASGSLPGTAILHLKQISLFSMICRLEKSSINQYARQTLLTGNINNTSWFSQVRRLLQQYKLPHPLELLDNPPPKKAFKKKVKAMVVDFWEIKLREQATYLPSLRYFHCQYFSLCKPHKLWEAAGSKSYEVTKARVQFLFLCSQYPCASLTRHWTSDNPLGLCTASPCREDEVIESPEHVLLYCPAYTSTRLNLLSLCLQLEHEVSHTLIVSYLLGKSEQQLMQVLLDCSSLPPVITAAQTHGPQIFNDLFYIGRTWCFSIHRERLKRLHRWNFR